MLLPGVVVVLEDALLVDDVDDVLVVADGGGDFGEDIGGVIVIALLSFVDFFLSLISNLSFEMTDRLNDTLYSVL